MAGVHDRMEAVDASVINPNRLKPFKLIVSSPEGPLSIKWGWSVENSINASEPAGRHRMARDGLRIEKVGVNA